MKRLTLNEMPFEQLVTEDTELVKLRREYQSASAEKRRKAAEFEYDSAIAAELFDDALVGMLNPGKFTFSSGQGPSPGAVVALAIDPAFAPGLLTVGATEYQLGRTEDAMKLLLRLVETPDEDFVEIIEKAADFLIDEKDYANAKCLYEAATERHPDIGIFFNGLGYCFAKLDKLEDAICYSRKAVELQPNDPHFLNDLGYTLLEYRAYKDAEEILLKAVALSDQGYDTPKNNLKELRRRMRLDKRQTEEIKE